MTGIILKIPRLRVSVVDSLTVYENDKSSSFHKSPFWDTRTWIKSPFWDTLCAFLFLSYEIEKSFIDYCERNIEARSM